MPSFFSPLLVHTVGMSARPYQFQLITLYVCKDLKKLGQKSIQKVSSPLHGGTYGDANSLLVFRADGVYNGHPIYKSESQGWTIYYRKAGYWVRDFNAVGDEWAGTVGIKRDGLFSANV